MSQPEHSSGDGSSPAGLSGIKSNLKLSFQGMLADYVSQTSPMIPSIVVHCVNEIEQRGLTEVRSTLREGEFIICVNN